MSDWSYVRSGSISDEVVGGVSSTELMSLAYKGEIRPKTFVFHPEHTKNQWVAAERIPKLLLKCKEGEEHRRQVRAEQLRKQQEWMQAKSESVSNSLRAGASHVHSVLGKLFPKREPLLRRCSAGGHHEFSTSNRCRTCGQPTVVVAGTEWAAIIKEFIDPFLRRNEAAPSHEVPADALVLRYLSSLERAATAVITAGELQMLKEVLGEAFPSKTRAEAESFLNSCVLRSDSFKFRDRIVASEQAGLDTVSAYVSVASHDPTFLPFLQQLLKERNREVIPAALQQQIDRVRKEQKLRSFATDLSQRRAGSFSVTIEMVDSMNPFNFELLLGMIYETGGYRVTETPKGSDQGADVFIEKAGDKTVIQAKLYSDAVGNKAVQEVIAARTHFKCHYAKVVTNREFTKSAIELAGSSGVVLIERDGLIALIEEFNRSPKDYARLATLFEPQREVTP